MDKAAFDSHPIWNVLSSLESAIQGSSKRSEPGTEEYMSRLTYVAALVKSHMDPSDVGPYSNAALTAVQNPLSSAASEVSNFASNGNLGHLVNADSYADQTLLFIGSLPSSLLKGGAAVQANKAFEQYRDAAQSAITSLEEGNAALRQSLVTQQSDAAQALATLQRETAALSAKIAADEGRLDTALTTNNDAFTAKQTEREEKFTEWLEARGEALKSLADTDLKSIQEKREAAEIAFAEVDQLRDDTQTVAGLAAGDQVARGYKAYSLRQWTAGLLAYLVGFVAIGTGIYFVVEAISGVNPEDDVTWQFALLKFGVTASVVFAAIIAFRLGSHLLAEASTAKRFELELKALGPLFPHDSEQSTLSDVKQDLIKRSFGQGWNTTERGRDVMDEKLIERVIEALARALVRPESS